MNNLVSLFAVEQRLLRLHQPEARTFSIAHRGIYVQRIQAKWAMIAIAAVCQGRHPLSAMEANEIGIFGFSAHTEPPHT